MESAIRARGADVYAGFLLPHLRPDMAVLDCGCGRGTITLGLAEAVPDGRVVGVDLDKDSLLAAQLSAARRTPSNRRGGSSTMSRPRWPTTRRSNRGRAAPNTLSSARSATATTSMPCSFLLITGYPEALRAGGVSGIALLAKPFKVAELRSRVAEILHGPSAEVVAGGQDTVAERARSSCVAKVFRQKTMLVSLLR